MSWDKAKKAIKKGNTDALVAALDGGVDINFSPIHGMSLLHHAAAHNNTDAIRLLCSNGANINIDNGRYKTPLFTAVSSGNIEAADALLDAGASRIYTYEMGRQITALHQAVISNQPRLVPLLARREISPNALSNFHETPMMNMFGNITRTSDIMTMGLWLILLGADIDLSRHDIYGKNLIECGEFTKQKETAECLVHTYATIKAYAADSKDSTVKSVCKKILAKESTEIGSVEIYFNQCIAAIK